MSETEAIDNEVLTKPKVKRTRTPQQIEQFKQMVINRHQSIAQQKKETKLIEAKKLLDENSTASPMPINEIKVRKATKPEVIESESDSSENEVIIVKKKKRKPKKTTVIVESSESDDSEEEESHKHPAPVKEEKPDRFRSQNTKVSNIKIHNYTQNPSSFFI